MYPLPHGVMGQYFAHQQSSAFGHAPRPAAGAEAAAFATEGHHAFRVTAVIAHHQESVLKTAAFQVILELPLDIPWQIRALCRQIGHESGLRYPSRLVRKVILTEYRYPLCITMIKGGWGMIIAALKWRKRTSGLWRVCRPYGFSPLIVLQP